MTFSGVRRQPNNALIGAVATHTTNVGDTVLHGMPGVGLVCVQARNDQDIGRHMLKLMRDGASPKEAFDDAVSKFGNRRHRQVLALPFTGEPFTFTGDLCGGYKGDLPGKDWAVGGNTLANKDVLGGFADAWKGEWTPERGGPVSALKVAALAGGDARGIHSAALMRVTPSGVSVKYVDYHEGDPLGALHYAVWESPRRAEDRPPNAADPYLDVLGPFAVAGSNALYNPSVFQEALSLAPPPYKPTVGFTEVSFLYEAGKVEEANELLAQLAERYPELRKVLWFDPAFGGKHRANVVNVLGRFGASSTSRVEANPSTMVPSETAADVVGDIAL